MNLKFKISAVVSLVAIFSIALPGAAHAQDDFMFKSLSTNLCLDGHGRGKDVKVSKCRTAFSAQRWSFNTDTGQIMHKNKKLCVVISNSNRANGARVVLWPCNHSANQRWKLGSIAGEDGVLQSNFNGKCIDVSKLNHTKKLANIHMWQCHKGKNQMWQLVKVSRSFKPKKKKIQNRFFPK
jgi:hypothetical protein